MNTSTLSIRATSQALASRPASSPEPEESISARNVATGATSGARLAVLDTAARQQRSLPSSTTDGPAPDGSVDDAAPSAAELEFRQGFTELAQDADAFHALMRDSFGDGHDAGAAETIRQQTQAGDFSWMPRIEFVSPEVLAGGNGAYDSANDRILLRSDLSSGELATAVLSEEVGHALDARLNGSDTAGDEGELFQALLAGENPDQLARVRMLRDDDHGQLTVDGKQIDVEFSWWSDNVTDPWNEHVVDPIVEHVIEPINEHVVQPVVTLVEDGVDIVRDVARWPLDVVRTAREGASEFFSSVFQGDWSGAWGAVVDTTVELAVSPIRQLVDTGVQVLHTGTVFLESVLGQTEQRDLTPEEIARLRPIYGDSIDYGKVQIHTGGIRESIGMRPHVVGNDIFMPEDLFDANGVLTVEGAETFTHEFGHVWQYQNRGSDYLSGALYGQARHGSGGVGTGEAYDWVYRADRGQRFNDMNEESQAELAAFIGLSIDPATGQVDRTMLETAIRDARGDDIYDVNYDVSDDLFEIVQEAHLILRAGE